MPVHLYCCLEKLRSCMRQGAKPRLAQTGCAFLQHETYTGGIKLCVNFFLVCKAKVAPGESCDVNLQALVKAATSLFERLQRGTINIHGKPLPLNGDLCLLFRADGLSDAEKQLLKCYLETTRTIAGCQAIRRRIRRCPFGFRCVPGEVIFVTVSPSR